MEEKKMTMITLCIQHGMENHEESELCKFIKNNALEGAEILRRFSRKNHYHIITEDIMPRSLGLEKWPGNAKKDIITESQAKWIKKTHSQFAFS